VEAGDETQARATSLDQVGSTVLPSPAEAAPETPAEEEIESPQLVRGALFGVAAAAVLGVIWYLVEVYWMPVAFVVFFLGWLTAMAVSIGASRKRGRPLQFIALGITIVAVLVVRFARDGVSNPAGFPQALFNWFQADPLTMIFCLLGLWYSFSTPGRKPQRRQQQPTPAAREAANAGEAPAGGEAEGQTSAEDAAPVQSAAPAADPARRCVRCQAQIPPGEALLISGGFRRGTVRVCPKCTSELQSRFTAETENVQLERAGLFGVGAAAPIAAIWYILGRTTESPFLAIIGFAAGWILPEVVRYGAGKKRGRNLQWVSVALTAAIIIGVNVALAAGDPAGLLSGLGTRLADPLTDVIYLLSLFQAYTGAAARKLGGVRESQQA
jgi:hypothetical protein